MVTTLLINILVYHFIKYIQKIIKLDIQQDKPGYLSMSQERHLTFADSFSLLALLKLTQSSIDFIILNALHFSSMKNIIN